MKPMPGSCIPHLHTLHRMWMSSRQRGSIVVMAAIGISTMVILLASIDIGYLFFQKRELQKIADLSALAGAQQLGRSTVSAGNGCPSSVITTAEANAKVAQKFSGTVTASCGNWDPVAETTAPHYRVIASGIVPNAVSVHVSRSFSSFFGAWASRTVSAVAIATAGSQIAVFSVGSKLLQVNGGVVPGLLTKLGVDINGTALVSYNGLANVSIKTGGLLSQLGFNIPVSADVGTIKQIVSTTTTSTECSGGFCPLNALLGAMATVGGQKNLIDLAGFVVKDAKVMVKLFSDATTRGVFTLLDAANGQAALNTDINLLELVTTTIGVANGHRFVDSPLSASIPEILSSQIKVGIVEPPSIGIGGVGTMAYTSQVRLYSHIQAPPSNATLPLKNLLKVDIPLAIDVVNGSGKITAMCNGKDANGNDTATIDVFAPILRACVGAINESTIFSTHTACNVGLSSQQNLISILGGTLAISTSFSLDALISSGTVTLSKGQSQTIGDNQLLVGTMVSNLTNAVLATLLGRLLNNRQGSITNSTLANFLLDASGNVLKSTLETLDTSLNSLKTFVNGLSNDVKTILGGSLTSSVINLLSGVGTLVGGLLSGIANLLGNLLSSLGCLLNPTDQCRLANQLSGNSSNANVSNVLLALLSVLEKLLEPVLNGLGSQLSALLNNLLGIKLGLVDVTLIDLKCGGGDNVKLVY